MYKKTIYLIFFLFTACSTIVKTIIPINTLPEPRGKYNIGTVLYHWTDESRKEWFSKQDTTDYRQLMVQIWYPSDEKPTTQPEPYMDHLDQRISEFSKQLRLPKFMISQITEVLTQSYYGIHISQKEIQFPLIIFSHGLGCMRTQNTAYIQELVSQGFVVAAMDHTYDANITIFPNGKKILYNSNLPEEIKLPDNKAFEIRYRQLSERTQDVIFVLNQLEKNNDTNFLFYNKLQLDNVGIFGHSFGGATSISSAFNDHRITACFTLDAWFEIIPQDIIKKGLNIAHFHLGQEKWIKPLNYKNRAELVKNSSGPNWISTFIGSKHFDFMDLPLFTKQTKRFKLTGEIEPIEFYNVLNELQLTFFNYYIKNSNSFKQKIIDENTSFFKIDISNNN